MTRVFGAALCALFLFVAVVGCAAGQANDEAQKLEAAGNPLGAADKYLVALGHDAKHQEARAGLARTLKGAYEQQLAVAKKHEDAEAYPDAAKAYDRLRALLKKARAHVELRFNPIDVAAKANEMKGAAADEEYAFGEQLLASKTWAGAAAAFQRAEAFVGGPFRESREKTGVALFSLSEELAGDGEFRVAATKAIEASRADPAIPRYKERAAAIHLALGRYFVDQGLCRQGLKDFEAANALVASAVPLEVLRGAKACAEVTVAVPTFENRTRRSLDSVTLEANLGDKLAGRIGGGASAFVRVLQGANTRFRVEGKLTQVEVERDARPRVSAERVSVTREIDCEIGQTPPCLEESALDLRRFDAGARLRIAGFVKVVDDKEQLLQIEFDVVDEDAVSFIGDLSVPLETLSGAKLSPAIDLRAQLSARRELRAESEMAGQLVDQIVEAVAAKVTEAVDAEPKANDPRQLDIPPLS